MFCTKLVVELRPCRGNDAPSHTNFVHACTCVSTAAVLARILLHHLQQSGVLLQAPSLFHTPVPYVRHTHAK